MPSKSYLSEHAVTRWYQHPHRAAGVARVLPRGDDEDLRLRLDHIEGEAILSEVDQVLLLVGTLCVQHDQPELWRTIYSAALAGLDATGDKAFAYLEQLTASALSGEL